MSMGMSDVWHENEKTWYAWAFFTRLETRFDMRDGRWMERMKMTHRQHSNKWNQKRYHTALIQFLQCHCKSVFEAHPPPPPPPSPSSYPCAHQGGAPPPKISAPPAAVWRTITSLDPSAPLLMPSISAAFLLLNALWSIFLPFALSSLCHMFPPPPPASLSHNLSPCSPSVSLSRSTCKC